MPIDWEAVSAIATVASTTVVAGTVILGYRQIVSAREQVSELKRTTQLQGTMALFSELSTAEHQAQVRFVLHELAERMRDEHYRSEVGELWTPGHHPELQLLRRYERFGTYLRHGLIESEAILDFMTPTLLRAWEQLNESGVIPIQRAAWDPDIWGNGEYLYRRARDYYDAHKE